MSIFDNAPKDVKLREEIALAVRTADGGFSSCTAKDVLDVARYGSVDESTIGGDFDDALTEAILHEIDKREIQI